eukprot:SAG22_NODE_3385_length_1742_cov_1.671942_2_plen_130_part_00
MNFALPAEVSASWRTGITSPVVNPTAPAGSLTIFLEATQHGTLPWFGSGERRALFYRYSPKYLNYVAGTYTTSQPAWVETELTEAQQAVLEPAFVYHHPLVGNDGETVDRPRRDQAQFSYDRPKGGSKL